MSKKEVKFSVGLGLFDYINPIFYAITTITLIINLKGLMATPLYIAYIVGACLSMIFGLTIPTVKLLVGLGKFEFKMPVNLVFYVNTGILISGLMLLKHVFNLNVYVWIIIFVIILFLLFLIYKKTQKFNTVAVLTGAFGYIMIYSSLITLAINSGVITSVVLYCIATIFFLGLCGIGIKANLKDARIHWIIETCNVLCQMFVAIATVVLFL